MSIRKTLRKGRGPRGVSGAPRAADRTLELRFAGLRERDHAKRTRDAQPPEVTDESRIPSPESRPYPVYSIRTTSLAPSL